MYSFKVLETADRTQDILDPLLCIWEQSVLASHFFLSKEDRLELYPLVKQGLEKIPILIVGFYYEDIVGFMGIEGEKLEMLFINPQYFGKGIGGILLDMAVNEYGVNELDVNEQNPHALEFYQHKGFNVVNRLPFDSQGRDFPLLQMKKDVKKNRML